MGRFERRLSACLGNKDEADAREQARLVQPELPEEPKMDHYNDHLSDSPKSSTNITINRPVLNQSEVNGEIFSRSGKSNFLAGAKKTCKKVSFQGIVFSLLPILQWLPKYKWRENVTFDLIAGFTIAVMQIPQGMAYALLGNLPPIVGIYMAFFPVIIYAIMGTSRHVSMGTFAVICLMTGKVAIEKMEQYQALGLANNPNMTFVDLSSIESIEKHYYRGGGDSKPDYNIVQIATSISLVVGFWQVFLGMFRMGFLSLLLSTELVSGFTTGAAIHVLTSQVKNLLGLSIPKRSGMFKILLTYIDISKNIGNVNVTAVIVSLITILILVTYNEIIKAKVSKKLPFPIPVELITIVTGTLVSRYWGMQTKFDVSIINYIPTGLPKPTLTPLDIIPDILVDGFIIGVVAYAISISMCKIFATKHNYQIDANQELIAEGASNIVGSFFSCAPISVSLSRSVIQDSVGGKTQLASFFSCSIIIFVLLWIGPFFESLPLCILSSIIVVALKGMLVQLAEFPKAYRESTMNGFIWMATFLSTVFLDIEYGLSVGIFLSLLTLIWRSNKGTVSILGAFGESGIYVDITSANTKEIPGVKIIKFVGSLNFATVEHFITRVKKLVPLDVYIERKGKGMFGGRGLFVNTISRERINDGISNDESLSSGGKIEDPIKWIVFDFSALSSVDPGAGKCLKALVKSYEHREVGVLVGGGPSSVLQLLVSSGAARPARIFPTVHDAVSSTCYVKRMTSPTHPLDLMLSLNGD